MSFDCYRTKKGQDGSMYYLGGYTNACGIFSYGQIKPTSWQPSQRLNRPYPAVGQMKTKH